jgi:hypothetical protein
MASRTSVFMCAAVAISAAVHVLGLGTVAKMNLR